MKNGVSVLPLHHVPMSTHRRSAGEVLRAAEGLNPAPRIWSPRCSQSSALVGIGRTNARLGAYGLLRLGPPSPRCVCWRDNPDAPARPSACRRGTTGGIRTLDCGFRRPASRSASRWHEWSGRWESNQDNRHPAARSGQEVGHGRLAMFWRVPIRWASPRGAARSGTPGRIRTFANGVRSTVSRSSSRGQKCGQEVWLGSGFEAARATA